MDLNSSFVTLRGQASGDLNITCNIMSGSREGDFYWYVTGGSGVLAGGGQGATALLQLKYEGCQNDNLKTWAPKAPFLKCQSNSF